MKNENVIARIIPVMLVFFTMGFIDLIGIATNYVKSDFDLSDDGVSVVPGLFCSYGNTYE